jgi:hypothetical protein
MMMKPNVLLISVLVLIIVLFKYVFYIFTIKDAVQSVCKQRLCLHFGIQNIEFYSTTIYIFMILEHNKLSRHNN